MAKPPRDKLIQLLLGSEPTTSDSASMRLPAELLELSVDGLGRIALPVSPAQAKKLLAAARPAHFGKGEETLLDASVRDTGEFTPAQVQVGGDAWDIDWTSPGGDDPDRLAEFLTSAEQRVFGPLTEKRRGVIHRLIDEAGLPVRHVTRRSGRPFTLVLTKTPELFAREERIRAQAANDLARLRETFGDAESRP
ncbi:MAG TPA: hypothetical protein PKE40_00450 [Arachnia sp.]|nr:hypothetical protein [Arachnia sp.]HMT84795.1 hypothetical protein [Arachnia sp.]